LKTEELSLALSKKFGKKVKNVAYQLTQLQGGTIADVKLISGIATTVDGEALPYKVALKTQRSELFAEQRYFEYELYTSGFSELFTAEFRCAECYHAEIASDKTEVRLWLEYIEGAISKDLTIEMREQAAEQLGRFQGRIYAHKPSLAEKIDYATSPDFMQKRYTEWGSKSDGYEYIRTSNCDIPKHLCEMLIEMDAQASEVFENLKKLPLVLCHRDYSAHNIFYSDNKIRIIDWDWFGWGYLGADITSLIADSLDSKGYMGNLATHYRRIVPAYYKGISEYMDISSIDNTYMWKMTLLSFGYRFVRRYMRDAQAVKEQQVIALQQMFELKSELQKR